MRPAPGWAQHRMPIPGLYQTGGTTHPGGSVTGGPGRNAAIVMLTDLGEDPGGHGRRSQTRPRRLSRARRARPRVDPATDRIMPTVRTSVTIRDVARLAEVHPGTVSRALNEQTRALVNQETAERVLRAAEQLGYRPNPIARGLKTNRSYTVGVLIPDLTNPLFPPIMRGIEDRLADAGYTLLIVNTDNDPERERSHMEAMRARQVDGFIAATARLDSELLADAAAGGAPMVLVNRSLEDGSLPAVTINDRQGIRLAVEHVAQLGHRRIGHVAGPQNVSTGHRRYLGFLESMARRRPGGAADAHQLRRRVHRGRGRPRLRRGAGHEPRLTAIVAANDLLAVGCYDALEAHGLRCPQDVSVVGFNDMPFVDRLRPPLTTGPGAPAGDRHRRGRPAAAAIERRRPDCAGDPARAGAGGPGVDARRRGADAMADERVQAAIKHWASRFIANGIDYNDFVRTTASIDAGTSGWMPGRPPPRCTPAWRTPGWPRVIAAAPVRRLSARRSATTSPSSSGSSIPSSTAATPRRRCGPCRTRTAA